MAEPVDTYTYVDEHGEIRFQALRYADKSFRQRRPDPSGTGWIWSTSDVEKVLYRLPSVLSQASTGGIVYVVEGEKDVHTLESLGKVATTSAGGAGRWEERFARDLIGARVVVMPDNDKPGMKHAWDIVSTLEKYNIPFEVVCFSEYKDISDVVGDAAGSTDWFSVDLDYLREKAEVKPPSKLESLITELSAVREDKRELFNVMSTVQKYVDDVQEVERDRGKMENWASVMESGEDIAYDWLIPGLLERQERVIVVAAEGVGKTMLSRQVALLSAAGIHPFTFAPMAPIRTLSVDLENPERIIKRTSRKIYEQLKMETDTNGMDAHLVIKPDGLDILNMEDRVLLEDYISAVEPDLFLIGPLYKAFLDPGNRTAEAVTLQVARFLDYVRHTYNCAIWIEHHAPLGDGDRRALRPFGSSVWSRWSEFGVAMRINDQDDDVVDLLHYRGQREERDWPQAFRKGGRYPFTTYTPETDDDYGEF